MTEKQEYLTHIHKKDIQKPIYSSPISIAKYLNVGYYVVIPLFAAVAVGVMLDRYFSTKPFFTVVLIGFGAVSSLYNIVRLIKDINN